MNTLYYGDCLDAMHMKRADQPTQYQIERESIDLIYLDPPFNSNREYHSIYKDSTGNPLPELIEGFLDIWTLDAEREAAIARMPVLMHDYGIGNGASAAWEWIGALRHTQPRLLAYLSYMAERLLVLRTLLKPTGSLYLHCDPTASHYLKVIMDIIFGHEHFMNEIVWHYRTGGASKTRFAKKHDVILFYAKQAQSCHFNTMKERVYYQKPFFSTSQKDETGRYYADVIMTDTWTDIKAIINLSKEREGYKTQKPIKLLERIITASTEPGAVVLDPFCGCATTLVAAHRLQRRWIGMDIAYHAIKRVVQPRLREKCALMERVDYVVEGVPYNRESAIDLWNREPNTHYQFQRWAVETVKGFVLAKRTADGGIDGRLFFFKESKEKPLGKMIIQVKGGEQIGIDVLRALRGVIERENAEMGGLIVRGPLGETKLRNFQQEMGAAGVIRIRDKAYPRLQLLTIDQILAGKGFDTPPAEGRGDQRQTEILDPQYR